MNTWTAVQGNIEIQEEKEHSSTKNSLATLRYQIFTREKLRYKSADVRSS